MDAKIGRRIKTLNIMDTNFSGFRVSVTIHSVVFETYSYTWCSGLRVSVTIHSVVFETYSYTWCSTLENWKIATHGALTIGFENDHIY